MDGAAALRRTVPELLAWRASATPQAIAFQTRQTVDDRWEAITWAEHQAAVRRVARALAGYGLHPGARVGILAPTSIRWEIAQMAALGRGAVVVGIDPNYPDAQLAEILREVKLTGVLVHDRATLLRLDQQALEDLKFIGCLYGQCERDGQDAASFDEILEGEEGAETAASELRPEPADAAIIVFSSGTTGKPRPILYSHGQVITAMAAILDAFPDIGEGSRLMCWLPLANLFQRMINFCAIACGASTYVISDPREVMAHIGAVDPDLLIGVPRFFERVHGAIQDRVRRAPAPMAWLGRWAISMGERSALASGKGTPLHGTERLLARIADRLVLSRLRRAFGANVRYLVSGSAPMSARLLDFYDAIGLPVYEAYGVSENIVPVAMNRPGARRPGTVGRPLVANDFRLARDGEIEIRGPGVFTGYWNRTGEEDRPDRDGFWRTGDLGALDTDGFLQIRGRKSDLFKTSTGRWVSPVEIEQRLRRIAYVDYAFVFGAGRKAVVAVLGIDRSRFATTVSTLGDATATGSNDVVCSDVASVTQDLPGYQRPAALLISLEPLSIDRGEVTTNLKPRRKAIEAKYSARLNELYAIVEQRGAGKVDGSRAMPVLEA
jgi:long-chain acyl-CoA synthetase